MSADERLELLRRFAPTLHFDALEHWRPSPVDEYLRHSTVLDDGDEVLPGTPPAEPAAIAFWEQHADGKHRALALHTVQPGEKAMFEIEHEGELLWDAAGYNFLRQRSDPILPRPSQPTHTVV